MRYGTLAAAIPLVSAGTSIAQCQGGTSIALSAASYGSTSAMFSINGASIVVAYYNAGGGIPGVDLLGGTNFEFLVDQFTLGGSDGIRLAASVDVSLAAVAPDGFGTFARLCGDVFGSVGQFCGAGGFLGIRQIGSGAPGWIELSLLGGGDGSVFLAITERGVEMDGDNTAITGDCNSLDIQTPVELTSFRAIVHNEAVVLDWETASELNNAGFELQRAGRDEAFEKITFVEGHGTSTDPHSYRFVDESVQANVHYRYRLKQIDLDGTTSLSFSEIIEVFTEDPSQIALSEFYPNPVNTGRTRLEISVAEPVEASIDIFDVRGALVESKVRTLNVGQNRLALDTGAFATGPHFAKIQVGERVLYRQFVVVK
jgi:hypothetical protein